MAIVQKAADFAVHARRVTLGKPHFDEVSQRKAAVATDIMLVDNGIFDESVFRHTAANLEEDLPYLEKTAWFLMGLVNKKHGLMIGSGHISTYIQ